MSSRMQGRRTVNEGENDEEAKDKVRNNRSEEKNTWKACDKIYPTKL